MSTKTFTHGDFAKQSMIELANKIMLEEKREMSFKDTFARVAQLKGWKEEDKQARIAQFYTDLNADGRFITQGANIWGLKKWYRKGVGGELVVDEEQSIKGKPEVVSKAKQQTDEEEELIIDDDIDESIDDYKDDDYYDDEKDDDDIDGFDEDYDEDDEDF